jgi:hypothetical protein
MPTGLTDSPALVGSNRGGSPHVAQSAINRSVLVILAATGVPQPVPGLLVPPGAPTVRVRGGNGTPTGNTGVVRVALYREALAGTGGEPITPDTEIIYPLDNLAQLWVAGTAGDGISVSVRSNATS